MTYGWAILIIAVVLGALFSLGVFNGANFAPKAPPGACQVFRPNGPGSTSFINLEGVCSGELPQYVATFARRGNIQVTSIPGLPLGAASRTVTAWFTTNSTGGGGVFFYGQLSCSSWFEVNIGQESSRAEINACCTNLYLNNAISAGEWYFVAFSYNGVYETGYLGSGYQLTNSSAGPYTFDTLNVIPFHIGYGADPPAGDFNGSIANVQMYNVSLSAEEIRALYLEGIGGTPIYLQNLVGWWPLNGNANDYSGNGNNGQATNVIYTSSWTNGYTTP